MWKFGRGDTIRTCALCVPNAALYQAEPHPDVQIDRRHKINAAVARLSTVRGRASLDCRLELDADANADDWQDLEVFHFSLKRTIFDLDVAGDLAADGRGGGAATVAQCGLGRALKDGAHVDRESPGLVGGHSVAPADAEVGSKLVERHFGVHAANCRCRVGAPVEGVGSIAFRAAIGFEFVAVVDDAAGNAEAALHRKIIDQGIDRGQLQFEVVVDVVGAVGIRAAQRVQVDAAIQCRADRKAVMHAKADRADTGGHADLGACRAQEGQCGHAGQCNCGFLHDGSRKFLEDESMGAHQG